MAYNLGVVNLRFPFDGEKREWIMDQAKDVVSAVAAPGERMVSLTVYFWTNGIASEPGRVIPKVAWPAGDVRINANPSHGIATTETVKFNTLGALPLAIEKMLTKAGVKLIADGRLMLPPWADQTDPTFMEKVMVAKLSPSDV